MTAYYNEIDPYAAQWLRNLISAGHIAPGDVDERSIVDVRPDDLAGYTQAHFFAGIGGWSLALRLAGWPDDRPVWTGSCPCQPLSGAGQRKGHADSRHLWPTFYGLISERRPSMVFGEQVAGSDGREWLSAVRSDLERIGYACGGADMPAAGVGAPHIRQRIWWVANADKSRPQGGIQRRKPTLETAEPVAGCSEAMANAEGSRLDGREPTQHPRPNGRASECCSGRGRGNDDTGDANHWHAEPDVGRMAHGVSNRVGRLRAYGNAIVPQVAAEFIKAAGIPGE